MWTSVSSRTKTKEGNNSGAMITCLFGKARIKGKRNLRIKINYLIMIFRLLVSVLERAYDL